MNESIILKELLMFTGLVWTSLIVVGVLYFMIKKRYNRRKNFF